MRTSLSFLLAAALGVSATFAKQDQPTVSASDKTITYGSDSFSPDYSGGADGAGNWQFCVVGYTNWTCADNDPAGTQLPNGQWVGSWDPAGAGTFGFWIGKCGNADWNTSNFAGQYTLTVNRGSQPGVWSNNATITDGDSFSPDFNGGADGAGNWQFCIGGYTNWTVADNGPGGTQLSNGQWAGSWTPPGPGTYSFWIGRCGDNNWYGSNYAGPYTLTVNARPKQDQSPTSISPSTASVNVGDSVTFTASGGSGTGDYVWSGDASGTGSTNTVTFTSTDTHYVIVYRQGDNNYNDSNTATATIAVQKRHQSSVSISPSSQTINVGDSITFSASGGDGSGGYNWSGSASGTGSTNTVTFSSAGSFDVTVYRSGDYMYEDSSPVTVTITVNAATYSLNVVNGSGSASGLTEGTQVTITANAPPSGQVFNGWSASGSGTIGNVGASTTTFSVGAGDATVTATYRALPPAPPTVTGGSASATVGTAFSYYISASSSAPILSYGATPLPPGLSINAGTGQISGTPTVAGTYNVNLSASNSGGTGNATLTITVSASGPQSDDNSHNQLNIQNPD